MGHDDQDMRHYGNLRKYMPITAGTFIVGWLAIAGVPPFSGFWSKDEILAGAYAHNKVLWVCGLIVALLTAFYMTRQIVMTFFGEERWRSLEDSAEEHDGHAHHLTPEHTPHESPWVITLPLVLLAGLAAVGGALNLPFTHSTEMLANWLEPVVGTHELGETPLLVLAVVAVVVALLGIAGAIAVYSRGVGRRSSIEQPAFANGWWIDHAYSTVVSTLGASAFNLIAWIDRNLVDGLVNGIGGGFAHVSAVWHSASTGRIRTYALAMTGGAALMLVYVILRMSV
jgi:NADH-quinone oxidoreductase subunit L